MRKINYLLLLACSLLALFRRLWAFCVFAVNNRESLLALIPTFLVCIFPVLPSYDFFTTINHRWNCNFCNVSLLFPLDVNWFMARTSCLLYLGETPRRLRLLYHGNCCCCFQGSRPGVSTQEEGICQMPRKSRGCARKSKQDSDWGA